MSKPNLTDTKVVTFFTNMNKNIHVKETNIVKPKTSSNVNMFFVK